MIRGAIQREIVSVGCRTFGRENMTNRKERLLRFLEEAIELVRAGGISRSSVEAMVAYEFGRDKGPDLNEEFGGAACTLFAAADAHQLDLLDVAMIEIRRVDAMPPGAALEKHAGKPAEVKASDVADFTANADGSSIKMVPR
jgi:hypothetical protein